MLGSRISLSGLSGHLVAGAVGIGALPEAVFEKGE